ncbi:methyltransferase [Virgisporangium aliadipatigenens]|uniref:Methyltransferase n=1 Tax=Virgisporangium aliadipatigenens TaxID=741659 RepID=A0A8J3YFM4_9ACTN|nr:class I SAM-dependent methyltransferase [Virgisporangium aliadipatigenens]GIJ44284.1 methyltransferase [Virgisporangium aliadipatigenens]
MTDLLSDETLSRSSVVANNAMNRERQLAGPNSYAKELGFDPTAGLVPGTAWLDLCCGSGRALVQAARPGVEIVGVDLVDAFVPGPHPAGVRLVEADVRAFAPERAFDLVTCVHGLHYVGDKLGLLARVAAWLAPAGRFVADLDLSSVRLLDGRPAGRPLTAALRAAGFAYDARRRRLTRTGPATVQLPYGYLGADDRAGPNYTGQPAVHSYYRELSR